MFSKHSMIKLFAAVAIAASIGFAGAHQATASPFITDTLGGNGHAVRHASAPVKALRAPKATTSCSAAVSWAFITDDQGIPWQVPVGSSLGRECQTVSAPSPAGGWTVVTDDQGIPWLSPAR